MDNLFLSTSRMYSISISSYTRIKLIWRLIKCSRKLSILLWNHATSWTIGQQEKLKARLQEKLHEKIFSKLKVMWWSVEICGNDSWDHRRKSRSRGTDCEKWVDLLCTYKKRRQNFHTIFTPTKLDFPWREIDDFCPFDRWWKQPFHNIRFIYKWWSCKCNECLKWSTTGCCRKEIQVNELCVVGWQHGDSKYEWYLSYVKQIDDGGYIADYLHSNTKGCNNKWKYSSVEDIQMANFEQMSSGKLKGNGMWFQTKKTIA